MQFGDYSPPAFPTLDQERDALQKGLGRAMQWTRAGRLDDEALLDACLHDRRYDHQCEDTRGAWYWQLIQAAGAERRFRVPILHAFYEMADEDNANQLCELAYAYAATGDETFRDLLYGIVENRPFADWFCLGQGEIVDLDGDRGFLFAARVRGRDLTKRAWEWHDGCLVDHAIEKLGEARVMEVLATTRDAAVRRFREGWEREKTRGERYEPGPSSVESKTLEDVFHATEQEGRCFWTMSWGRRASERDLQAVLDRLWAESKPQAIAKLLRVFGRRALPVFDPRLIDFCRHSDENVRFVAYLALEQNRHPLVHEFALSELQHGLKNPMAAGLFINNYEPGDEQRILEAMQLPEDVDDLHRIVRDLTEILEENPQADASQLGVIGYMATPCQRCRFWLARVLHERMAMPQWMVEECRFDSNEECHELVDLKARSSLSH